MSYWDTLPPTPKQEIVIQSYNKTFGVEIFAGTKQKAHNVIAMFVPNQILEFTEKGYIKGTDVKYIVTNREIFENNPYTTWLKRDVKSIRFSKDMKTVTFEVKSGISKLDLIRGLNRDLENSWNYSSIDDSTDDVSMRDDEIDFEQNRYGPDSFWDD